LRLTEKGDKYWEDMFKGRNTPLGTGGRASFFFRLGFGESALDVVLRRFKGDNLERSLRWTEELEREGLIEF